MLFALWPLKKSHVPCPGDLHETCGWRIMCIWKFIFKKLLCKISKFLQILFIEDMMGYHILRLTLLWIWRVKNLNKQMSHWRVMAIWRHILTSLKLIHPLPLSSLNSYIAYTFLSIFRALFLTIVHIHILQLSSSPRVSLHSNSADFSKVTKYSESGLTSELVKWNFLIRISTINVN